MSGPPAFLAAAGVTEAQLSAYLRSPEPQVRSQWQALVLREARYEEVWRYLTLEDILTGWPRLERHLGTKREPWLLLLEGWREDGLIP